MSQTATILRLVKCHYCKKHIPFKDAEILVNRIDPKDFHTICWFICKKCAEKYRKKLYELDNELLKRKEKMESYNTKIEETEKERDIYRESLEDFKVNGSYDMLYVKPYEEGE